VSAEAPFGGGVFIADSTAWWRADRLPENARDEWQRALANGQIAATAPITLEILYSAQTLTDYLWEDVPLVVELCDGGPGVTVRRSRR